MHVHKGAKLLIAMFAVGILCIHGVASAEPTASAIFAGCHEITPEERTGLLAMGALIPSSGMFCDKDKALLYGGCETNPYPYLQTKDKTGRPDTVSGLNSDFACRLSKFLKAADAAGQNITIASGYRSVELQKQLYDKYIACGKCGAPVAPPGSSKHNFGLAVDLSFSGQRGPTNTSLCMSSIPACNWAHTNFAQFNLRYPMEYEPWHIEPAGAVNGKQQPLPQTGWTGDQSSTPYSNTGAFTSSMWNPSMTPNASLFSPLAGALTSAFTQQSAPTTPTYPSTPTYPEIPVYTWPTATTTFEVPAPYTYNLPTTTNATTTKQISDLQQIQLMTKEFEWYNTSTQIATSTPTQTASTETETTEADTAGSNVKSTIYDEERPIATTSVDVDPIHVTATFGEQNQVRATVSSSTSALATMQKTLITLMTKLRDTLLTLVQKLSIRIFGGSKASVQTATTTATTSAKLR